MRKITAIIIILLMMIFCFYGSNKINRSNSSNENVSKATPQSEEKISKEKISEEKINNKNISNQIPQNISPVAKKEIEGIPVLMYHSIGYEKGNPVRMPPETLDREMKYLRDNNYNTISLDELYNHFKNGEDLPKKSLVLTFDDGYEDNYTKMYPIIKKYNLKATVFVITNTIDKDPSYLNSKQIVEMQNNGIDIQSHTVTHRDLNKLTYAEQLKEIKDSKETLQKLLGKEIKYIAYPSGKFNADTIKAAEEAKYYMAFTTLGRWSDESDELLTLDRVFISTFYNMDIFKERISNPNYKMY